MSFSPPRFAFLSGAQDPDGRLPVVLSEHAGWRACGRESGEQAGRRLPGPVQKPQSSLKTAS